MSKIPLAEKHAGRSSAPDEFLESLYQSIGNLKHDFRNRNLNRLVAKLIQGESVLDVGCGNGGLVAELRRQGKDALGLEPNPKLIDIATRLHPAATILHGSGEDVVRMNRHFDTVTMADVLEHVVDDLGQLEMLHTCLKPGGRLVLVVPAHQWLFGERDRLNGHYRRYSRRRLFRILEASGYKIEFSRSWNFAGVVPYWFCEKILGRPLRAGLRHKDSVGRAGRVVRWLTNQWLRSIESRVGFGCGLSLVCVARPTKSVR